MITNYIIYFYTLSEYLKIKQFITFLIFFISMFIISVFIDIYQHNDF